jgi:YbbR domain-containing protein
MFEEFFKKNLSLKILSLFLALCLWLVVHITQRPPEEKQSEMNLELPLSVENLASNLLVLEAPDEVFVTVSGPSKALETMKPSDFKAYVDVQGKRGGAYEGLPVHVTAPSGFTVVAVNPPSVNVVLDEESQKKVAVTWEVEGISGAPPIKIQPEEVTISGSKLLVDRVVLAEVKIPQASLSSNLTQKIAPIPVDAIGRPVPGVHVSPPMVQVLVLGSPLIRPVVVRPTLTGTASPKFPLEEVSVFPPVVLAQIPKDQEVPDFFSTSPIDITGKKGTVIEKVLIVVPPGDKLRDKNEVTVVLKFGKP